MAILLTIARYILNFDNQIISYLNLMKLVSYILQVVMQWVILYVSLTCD